MDVYVFRTNILSSETAHPVANRLDTHERVARWTIDFGDRDKVLRVEAERTDPAEIAHLVTSAGFACEEMR
jgi:short-subunit dehydrogenase